MSHKRTFSHPRIEPKRPFSQRAFPGAALAILSLVLVCPQGGCLVPQTVDPKVASPHPPPHIVVETIAPYLAAPILTLKPQGTADVAPCHCVLEFSGLAVEEQDPTIRLEARWFIDYDASVPASNLVWLRDVIEGTFDDPLATQRNLGAFIFDAAQARIGSSGPHVVEVVVGESEGFDPSSTALPNRAMKAGYTPAVYRFFVDVRVELVQGECPQTLPSRRVCQ